MAFLTEQQIELAAIDVFVSEMGYVHFNCEHYEHLGRHSKQEVFGHSLLSASLKKLNPNMCAQAHTQAMQQLTKLRVSVSPFKANCEFYELIKKGIEVEIQTPEGRKTKQTIRVLDFNNPLNNHFLLVSQLWIEGKSGNRRPDLLIYINGIPFVFIELKRSDKLLIEAHNDNLVRYRDVIPQLFVPNVACILSNGAESKVGAFNAGFAHFGDWFRASEDKEQLNKKQTQAQQTSLYSLIRSFCKKEVLIDYIENFVLYDSANQVKILAKNHQYLGVNNLLKSYETNKDTNKLGTFWHTQGSGKSYSIVFFTEKLKRKYIGDFTFLIITDREDLDKQIHENYTKVGIINEAEKVRPTNSKTLREFLQGNKGYIFTLIHKFGFERKKNDSDRLIKTQIYPELSKRSDIIVVVDEAHRTQYATFADNMRVALPNAKYIAFTGTPLIERGITQKYFGDIVSEYNFAQSIEDGATVPLYYNRRVPQVEIANLNLQKEFEDILSSKDLTEEQIIALENKFARELEVLKRDDRLETIAKDIVAHFPTRGYFGKAMVVSIDKFTTVIMYDKVKHYWGESMKKLQKQITRTTSAIEKQRLQTQLDYMRSTQMAVVISGEDGEEEKFARRNLLIKPHRDRMNEQGEKGKSSIEADFKNDNNPLRLVFVCSMWLTGFDVPTLSTLYLDKPMQNHTLMQTIARVNRVTDYTVNGVKKISGEIVDYYGVFRNLKKALSVYAEGSQTSGMQTEEIVKPTDFLIKLLDTTIEQAVSFCKENGFDPFSLLTETDTKVIIDKLEDFADLILAKDEIRKSFNVYQNTLSNFYAACKPDINKQPDYKHKVGIFEILRDTIERKRINPIDYNDVTQKITDLLDLSVLAKDDPTNTYQVQKTWILNLSKLNYEKLREEFPQIKHKNIALTEIRAFIEQKLSIMLQINPTRKPFVERYEQLIQGYNEGKITAELLVEEYLAFMQGLEEEEKRHLKEDLTEEELVIFDLLEKPKLTPAEKQKVKQTARELIAHLKEKHSKIFVIDWDKNEQTRLQVKMILDKILNEHLPESYDRLMFGEKSKMLFNHLLRYSFVNT